MKTGKDYSMVVAIDFGTARSGFAYSEPTLDKLNTRYRRVWPDAPPGIQYPKTPTLSLYDSRNQLVAWGYSAEKLAAECRDKEGFALAREFKVDLHSSVNTGSVVTKDWADNGPKYTFRELLGGKTRTIDVVRLISDYLTQIKSAALADIRKEKIQAFPEKDIFWCLTVPANWTDLDKQWMRVAAQRAGLITAAEDDQERLLFALEPEAAAVYVIDRENLNLNDGDRFMILDCGGGTVDITVHEKTGSQLKALPGVAAGMYGSTRINAALIAFLVEQISEEIFEEWRTSDPRGYTDVLLHKIEHGKCAWFLNAARDFFLELPFKLRDLLRTRDPERVRRLGLQDGDPLCIPSRQLKHLITPVIRGLLSTVEESFKSIPTRPNGSKVDYIFMVGGFSEGTYLRDEVQGLFGQMARRIVAPGVPSEAVLLGAVSFAVDPSVIRSRRSRLTYGKGVSRTFIEGLHDPKKKFYSKSWKRDQCNNIFSKFVTVGEEIEHDEIRIDYLNVLEADDTEMDIALYATKAETALYTDDPGVENLRRQVHVKMPDTTGGLDRRVEIEYHFGGTEIKVKAKDPNSGEYFETSIGLQSYY
ncbi:MAG: Hsp70 family protein [Acidobacteria bacterium]|nr:Hsp70 family protein [Acidobacteriota bacterium]